MSNEVSGSKIAFQNSVKWVKMSKIALSECFKKPKIALIECYFCTTYYITLTSLYATELVLCYFGNILQFTK